MSGPLDPDLVDRVRRRLLAAAGTPTAATVAAAVRAEGGIWGGRDLSALLRQLEDEVCGAGPLSPLLRDPQVTDVLVNAPDEVWVERSGQLERTQARFADDAAVRAAVQRMIAPSGRRLDNAQPWVDARLPGGVRLHAVLPPVATKGTTVSLRVQRSEPFSLDELVRCGTVGRPLAALLTAVVAARLALVVTGGTGSGKTTLLCCLLGMVQEWERIVTVEDSVELLPRRPHVVGLESRPANVDGAGEVTLRQLVRQAMRMRPDRLVVGEVRGGEVVDLLAALNTGHDGGMTTLHANSPRDVPARIEALAVAAGLGRDAVHAQLASGLQAAVHLQRGRDGSRMVSEVAVFERVGDLVQVRAAVRTSGGERDALLPGPGAASLREILRERDGDWSAVPGS